MPDVIKIFFYIMAVMAVVGVGTWAARRFMAGRVNTAAGRGRMPRLAVIAAEEFGDRRRKLVLVRRDNVEHLLMVGGPTDVVIETNIQRAATAGREGAARAPASDPSWLDNEPTELREPAPMPEPPPPPRPSRPPLAGDEPPRRPPPMPAPPERRPEPRHPEPRHEPREPMAGFAAETMRPPMRVAKPPMPRQPLATSAPPAAPPVAPPVASPASEAAAQADQNLAEMAQRLEAALRRPGAEPSPSSVAVNPVDRIGAPPVAPDGPPARNKAPPVEPPQAADAPRKEETGFESLEAEMASLLGRPKNPS